MLILIKGHIFCKLIVLVNRCKPKQTTIVIKGVLLLRTPYFLYLFPSVRP